MRATPGETTISDIGRGLGITRQGASKIVAGLRDRGYLEVTPSAVDGREASRAPGKLRWRDGQDQPFSEDDGK
jgi:hypothetical protein